MGGCQAVRALRMKVLNCYHCGSRERSFYAEENGFSLVKCKGCGLLYVEERPDDREIAQAHQQGKHGGMNELEVTGCFNEKEILRYLHVLDDLFKGALDDKTTWLDIGCGHGEFLVALQKYSNKIIYARGTEPNRFKQESACKRGLDVSCFDIELHEEAYDVVSLLNVYSHLPDPPAFLKKVKRLLTPGGEIVIETGDTADFAAKDHPRPLYLPDHLSFASEKVVTGILRRLGFQILSINKYPALRCPSLHTLVKETVKAVLPERDSHLRQIVQWKRYSQADMFIRARMERQ